MLRKIISFTDFNGNQRTEEHFFNITKAELTEMDMRDAASGGMKARLQRVIDGNDGNLIVDTFKYFIEKSYGVKSEDGRRHIKSREVFEAFSQTPAYDVLFMELVTDPKAAADFVNAILPQDTTQPAIPAPPQN